MLWVYPPKEEEVVEQRKLSDAQKAEIKSIFVLYDANNNGLLEKKELFEALTASSPDATPHCSDTSRRIGAELRPQVRALRHRSPDLIGTVREE